MIGIDIQSFRNEIGKRIRDRRNQLGKSLVELESETSITNSALSKIERGAVAVSAENLYLISKALDKPIYWFFTGEEPRNIKEQNTLFFDEKREIPSHFHTLGENERNFIEEYILFILARQEKILNEPVEDDVDIADLSKEQNELIPIVGVAAAGEPLEAIKLFGGYLDVPIKYKGCIAVKVKGDSMVKSDILDQGYVIVRQQPTVENGEIALIMINNQVTIKKVKLTDDNIILIPNNDDYSPITYKRKDKPNILGKVVHFIPISEANIIDELD